MKLITSSAFEMLVAAAMATDEARDRLNETVLLLTSAMVGDDQAEAKAMAQLHAACLTLSSALSIALSVDACGRGYGKLEGGLGAPPSFRSMVPKPEPRAGDESPAA